MLTLNLILTKTQMYFIGCLFHWKQCLRRKLDDLRIHKFLISYLVGEYDEDAGTGLILLLTIIDPKEIVIKGIPYIRNCLQSQGVQKSKTANNHNITIT